MRFSAQKKCGSFFPAPRTFQKSRENRLSCFVPLQTRDRFRGTCLFSSVCGRKWSPYVLIACKTFPTSTFPRKLFNTLCFSFISMARPTQKGSSGKKKKKKHKHNCPLRIDSTGKHACFVCEKKLTKVGHHFKTYHRDDRNVKKLLRFMKARKNRQAELLSHRLIKKGDHDANLKAVSDGHGAIIVVRRVENEEDGSRYRPCPFCFGWFLRR